MLQICSISCVRIGFVLFMCLTVLLQGCKKRTRPAPDQAKDIRPDLVESSQAGLPDLSAVEYKEIELHINWVERTHSGRMVTVIDGQPEPGEYKEIGPVIFSPDGNAIRSATHLI